MDYLDPHKEANHRLILMVGYGLIAIAIAFATYILVNQAYGYGLKDGKVIQNGELFVSSQPQAATIKLNGVLNKAKTNTRLFIPGNIYTIELQRDGYRPWQRTMAVLEGDVKHLDYPLLIPKTLKTTTRDHYAGTPGLVTQSPDNRWLVVEQPGSLTDFWVYDLKNPTKDPVTISLPTNLLTSGTTSNSWQFVDWADDDQHLLLEHLYDGKTEYVLVDRTDPGQSVNLNRTLKIQPVKLTLNNKKYDQYYVYNSDNSLQSVSLKTPTVVKTVLSNVLAYQSYGSDEILYVTPDDAPAGKVLVKLLDGDQTYILHSLPANTTYLVDLTTYSGTLYVVAGAASENKVYIYQDPISQLNAEPDEAVGPIQVLHVIDPTYVSFSDNAQFVMAEGGNHFGVYDIENQQGFNYTVTAPLDPSVPHASWMDGDRLVYVSNGVLQMIDYDDANAQSLVPASAAYPAVFAPDFHYVYTVTPNTAISGEVDLTQTSLLTPADQ